MKRMKAILLLLAANEVETHSYATEFLQKTQSTNRHRRRTGDKCLHKCCHLLNRQMNAVSSAVLGAMVAALWEVVVEGELRLPLTGNCYYSH
jgi:hypothetical protein